MRSYQDGLIVSILKHISWYMLACIEGYDTHGSWCYFATYSVALGRQRFQSMTQQPSMTQQCMAYSGNRDVVRCTNHIVYLETERAWNIYRCSEIYWHLYMFHYLFLNTLKWKNKIKTFGVLNVYLFNLQPHRTNKQTYMKLTFFTSTSKLSCTK